MAGIFISYRREDTAWCAGRLRDSLSRVFDPKTIFMDFDSIGAGEKFKASIAKGLTDADVVLVLIGKRWLGADAETGGRRIDDPNDFVRKEVSAALEQDKQIMPVLVDSATLPAREELPEGMKSLLGRQAESLRYMDFQKDAGDLIKALGKKVRRSIASRVRLWLRRVPVGAVVSACLVGVFAEGVWQSAVGRENAGDRLTSAREEGYQAARRDLLSRVQGFVNEADGKTPIDGADVRAIVRGQIRLATTTTDGKYSIDLSELHPLAEDRVEVAVAADHRQPDSVSFQYQDTLRHRFALKKAQK
jgi:hypothetical protein